MIRKVKGGWVVISSTKGRLSKKPMTKAAAKRQHAAVSISKLCKKKPGLKVCRRRRKR